MNDDTARRIAQREAEIAALRAANHAEFVAVYGEAPTAAHVALTTLALLEAGRLAPLEGDPGYVRLPGGGVQSIKGIKAAARKAAK